MSRPWQVPLDVLVLVLPMVPIPSWGFPMDKRVGCSFKSLEWTRRRGLRGTGWVSSFGFGRNEDVLGIGERHGFHTTLLCG